jgi:transcriptional regulator with XRE-family HTH domain
MENESFGDYIRKKRNIKKIPLRKVAAFLDIDTSILSKVERGERPISIDYLNPLSRILELELKEIQVKFIVEKIYNELGLLEFLKDGLKEAEKQISKQLKQ